MWRFISDVNEGALTGLFRGITSLARTLTTFPVTTVYMCLTKMNVCYDQC